MKKLFGSCLIPPVGMALDFLHSGHVISEPFVALLNTLHIMSGNKEDTWVSCNKFDRSSDWLFSSFAQKPFYAISPVSLVRLKYYTL